MLHKDRAGSSVPNIAAIYAHGVLAEDGLVNGMVMSRAPLCNADLAATTGVRNESPPMQNDELGEVGAT